MMVKKTLVGLVGAMLVCGSAVATAQEVKEIRWGTSRVGSSGHRALTTLANVLNDKFEGYRVVVQPTPGAIISVKGYATGQFEGYYGADIAFYELANDINRFEGFQGSVEKQPVQSFWTFTVEVGLGISEGDRDKYDEWGDLSGETVFTGPAPWDTRAQTERAMAELGVEHEYVEVDLSTVGALLDRGEIAAFGIYSNAEANTAPWITETSLATDWEALNPSAEELETLKAAGFNPVEVDPGVFAEEDLAAEKVILLPFYYGLHVGLEIPEDDVYRMLTVIEENVDELAAADPAFSQIADDMPAMQVRGVEAAADLVPIHPGLARYMQEKGVWEDKWDSRVADAG